VLIVGGHSEALNVEFTNDFDVNEVMQLLRNRRNVVQDNLQEFEYPMPMYAEGKKRSLLGVLEDESQPNTLNMWVVADNLRKGAATNTIQIAT
jgi:aspartate-semialdehyde dehydrogenase